MRKLTSKYSGMATAGVALDSEHFLAAALRRCGRFGRRLSFAPECRWIHAKGITAVLRDLASMAAAMSARRELNTSALKRAANRSEDTDTDG